MTENITLLKPNSQNIGTVCKMLDISRVPYKKNPALPCRLWTAQTVPVSDLKSLRQAFEDNQNCIRIYGLPDKIGQPIERRKRNFHPAPLGYHFHVVDADKWIVPTFDPNKTEAVISSVRSGIKDRGLSFLDGAGLLIVLSGGQSFNKTNELNAHIYFRFNSPINLDEMETVAKAVNDASRAKIFDPAMYRIVQPDYFARPRIIRKKNRIKDPIVNRMILIPGPSVAKEEWTRYKARFFLQQLVFSVKPVAYPGLSWQEIIDKYCGQPHINEPCMMAGIRLVREKQPSPINVDALAKILYTRAWAAILQHGKRGTPSDQAYYNMEKFKGYIQYPIDHPVGSDPGSDRAITSIIDNAVKQAPRIGGQAFLTKEFVKAYDILEKIDAVKAVNLGLLFTKYKVKRSVDDLRKQVVPRTQIRPGIQWYKRNFDIRYRALDHKGCIYYQDRNDGAVHKLTSNFINQVKVQVINNINPIKVPNSQYSDVLDSVANPLKTHPSVVYERMGWHPGKECAYYNAGGRTIEISKSGLTDLRHVQSPVIWERSLKNAHIEYGGDFIDIIQEIFDFEAVTALAWCVFSVLGWPYRPILHIEGPPASGKTALAKTLCRILDPEFDRVLNTPTDEAAFFDRLSQGQLIVFDNLSTILKPAQQEALCTLATGGMASFRRPYGIVNEIITDKSIIMTSIESPRVKADLLSRMLTIQMSGLVKHSLAKYNELLRKYLPYLRGAVLTTACEVLARPPRNVAVRDYPMAAMERLFKRKFKGLSFLQSKWHDAALNDPKLLILLIYLKDRDIRESTHAIQREFSEWVLKNHHKKYEIFDVPVIIDWYDSFRSPMKVGKLISVNKQLIESTLDMSVRPIRCNHWRGWEIKKLLDINDIL